MLRHDTLRNTAVATEFGEVKFDDKGESKDLNVTNQKKLGKLTGFHYIDENAEKKKREQAQKEAKEKEEKAKQEEKEEQKKKDAEVLAQEEKKPSSKSSK